MTRLCMGIDRLSALTRLSLFVQINQTDNGKHDRHEQA